MCDGWCLGETSKFSCPLKQSAVSLPPGPGWALIGNGGGLGMSCSHQPELILGVEAGDSLTSDPL